MFTDSQVTPVRLEIFIDMLRSSDLRNLTSQAVERLMQPDPLLDSGKKPEAAGATIRAAKELGLVEEDAGSGRITLLPAARKASDAKSAIVAAFDEVIFSSTNVEPYFALFYAFVLGLGKGAHRNPDRETWVTNFNRQVFAGQLQPNPFNTTKLSGLHRWLEYTGLGWYDPAGEFQANPYNRLHRVLICLFDRKTKITSEHFMQNLAEYCPELDGGMLFRQANPHYTADDRRCTLGLSHALVEMEADGLIRLYRPLDSGGWSVEDAEPAIGPDAQSKGGRLSFLERIK